MLDNSIQVNKNKEVPETVLLRSLTQEEVEKGKSSLIHKGRWSKADLFLVHTRGYRIVLKDFSKKTLLIRLLGRLQIWREIRAYRAVQGMVGIPKFYKELTPYSFVMEFIEGIRLADYRGDIPPRVLLEDLKELVLSIHRVGVFHNDIRGRDNVVVRKDGRLMLLDFAGAVCFKPGGVLDKILSPLFHWIDYSAYLKWKSQLTPEDMSGEEQKSIRKFNTLRKFWIFNLKRQK